MTLPPLRAQHWLLFALLAAGFFAWGAWLIRGPQSAAPLPWLAHWQTQILQPLAEDRLDMAGLSAATEGELWLQPQLDGPRLLYRAELTAAEGRWHLQAELRLSRAERDSLAAATGLQPRDAEQPLSRQLLTQLARQPVLALDLTPPPELSAARVAATFGQPRLRLQLPEGEAWVYPALGLTAHVHEQALQLLRAVPKSALQH